MVDANASRVQGDGCVSGSSNLTESDAPVAYQAATNAGAITPEEEGKSNQCAVNLATWQKESNERYSSMATMLEEVKRDINSLSYRLQTSPYFNESGNDAESASESSSSHGKEQQQRDRRAMDTGVESPPSSEQLAHSVRQSLSDMGRKLRETEDQLTATAGPGAAASPDDDDDDDDGGLGAAAIDLQMDSFPTDVKPRVARMEDISEDELYLNPFRQEFLSSNANVTKTWRSPSDYSSTIAGDLAMSADYAEFSDRTRNMLQRIRRERGLGNEMDLHQAPTSPPGSPTFEPVEYEGLMNIEDFILDSFIDDGEHTFITDHPHRYLSLPTILEERPEDIPPSSSSSASDASDEEEELRHRAAPAAIEMQTLSSSENVSEDVNMTTDLDGPFEDNLTAVLPPGEQRSIGASYFYGAISSTPNLAMMVERDAALDPGYVEQESPRDPTQSPLDDSVEEAAEEDTSTTTYFSAPSRQDGGYTSDTDTFVTMTSDDDEVQRATDPGDGAPQRLASGTLLYRNPSTDLTSGIFTAYDCCESSSESETEQFSTLGRAVRGADGRQVVVSSTVYGPCQATGSPAAPAQGEGELWSPDSDRSAPDGSTEEEVVERTETRRVETTMIRVVRQLDDDGADRMEVEASTPPSQPSQPAPRFTTFLGVKDTRKRMERQPDFGQEVKVRPEEKETVVVARQVGRVRSEPGDATSGDSRQDEVRLSTDSNESVEEKSTLSEFTTDTSEYSTETATETDSETSDTDSCGEDYETDMSSRYRASRSSPDAFHLGEDKRRRGFKPTLPPAAVYKPPLSKRPKMSSITEGRSTDEDTSDDDGELETICDQPVTDATIRQGNNDADSLSIQRHVDSRAEHESSARENLTGAPNSELTLSLAAAVRNESEEVNSGKGETKIARESDVTLSHSSSTDEMEFEDAMEELPAGQKTEVSQELLPVNTSVAAVSRGPVVAVASSRALIRRGGNFRDSPKTKPLVSAEVKAEASGASPSIAAARATAKAASIATATASMDNAQTSPISASPEELHIYISTSCTIRNQPNPPELGSPDDISLTVTRKKDSSDYTVTDAHQLPQLPPSEEAPERENIFSWLDASGNKEKDGTQVTTHELPSPKGEGPEEMHTLESAAFQVLEQHTLDSQAARDLAHQVVDEVRRDMQASPTATSPRQFSKQEKYSDLRKSLENLHSYQHAQGRKDQKAPTRDRPTVLRRTDIRMHQSADKKDNSHYVEMSDVSVKKMPKSDKIESTFISDSSGSSSPNDAKTGKAKIGQFPHDIRMGAGIKPQRQQRQQQHPPRPQQSTPAERYKIRPEYKSVLQAPIDLSSKSYNRSSVSPARPIADDVFKRQEKRSDFFTCETETMRQTPVEMKLAAVKNEARLQERSRPSSAASGNSTASRLRDVVDDETVYSHRRRRRSCRATDIDEAIRTSRGDLSNIDACEDANGYDVFDTVPGKYFSVSLYDLTSPAATDVSSNPANPANKFFGSAKSYSSLLQTDIDTGANDEEPLVIETDVDMFARDLSSNPPSKAHSMVNLMAGSPVVSQMQTYDFDDNLLNRTQSMVLSHQRSVPLDRSAAETPHGSTLAERLEKKAKSQTELRIARSLTKLNVPAWLDNMDLNPKSETIVSRHHPNDSMGRPERPHSASSLPSTRRPVVIETRVMTPNPSFHYSHQRYSSGDYKFELPSQKFRGSFNEKLQPIRSKLRDSLPDLYTNGSLSAPVSPSHTSGSYTVPRQSISKEIPPLQPIRLDAADFAPKKTVRQVKREKTVETRTVQRSEIVMQGTMTTSTSSSGGHDSTTPQNGSPEKSNDSKASDGQSSPDSGYVGSRTWPRFGSASQKDAPSYETLGSSTRSVKITENTVIENSVCQGDNVVESDRYRTSTHEEWTDNSNDVTLMSNAIHDFVQARFDMMPKMAQSNRESDIEYVHAVSDAIRYFGLTEPHTGEKAALRINLNDDEVLAALVDSRKRGVDISALLVGEGSNVNSTVSPLHAGIVNDNGRYFLQCVRPQCQKRALLMSARQTYCSCPACYTYYCSELCCKWHRGTHMAQCVCSRLTTTCQKIIRCIHTNSKHRRPIIRLARAGLNSFGRGFILLSFSEFSDARRFLNDTDNDLTSAPCYVPTSEPSLQEVFGKSVESIRISCNDYDPQEQFVIIVTIASSTGRLVKKSATLPFGDELHEKTAHTPTAQSIVVDVIQPEETPMQMSMLESLPPPIGDQRSEPARIVTVTETKAQQVSQIRDHQRRDSDEETVDSSEDSEESTSSSSEETDEESENEEDRRKAQEINRRKNDDEERRRKEIEESKRREEAKRREEEEIRRMENEERKRKEIEEARQREEMKRREIEEKRQKETNGKEASESESESDSSSEASDSESDSSDSSESPPAPSQANQRQRGVVIRASQVPVSVPVPSRPPPPRPPVNSSMTANIRIQYPPLPPKPKLRATAPTATATAQPPTAPPRVRPVLTNQPAPPRSPSGSISSQGSSNVDSWQYQARRGSPASPADSSACSTLDRPGRLSLLSLTERKMMAHGVDLRTNFPELHSQLVRFVEQNVPYMRRTIYPTDSRTGRRMACTFICGREPIIQFVPQTTSRTSTPSPGLGRVDANFNVELKKPTVETEL